MSIVHELRAKFGKIVHVNVALADISQWRVGGVASCIVEPVNSAQVQEFVRYMWQQNAKYLVIGETTNLLFGDEGVDVPILKVGVNLSSISVKDQHVTCGAGVWVPLLARESMKNSLSGLEHIVGIPGALGGLICMNGGSQRKGIGSHVVEVEAVTYAGEIINYSQDECGFSYRSSVFKANQSIITSVKLLLNKGAQKDIRNEMLQILRERRLKFPRKKPNCGSVFISDPKMYDTFGPPGKVIELCGLKGVVRGGAQISPLHANFIVNNGSASALDILYLIHLTEQKVKERTGCSLKAETLFVKGDGTLVPTHVKAAEVWTDSVA